MEKAFRFELQIEISTGIRKGRNQVLLHIQPGFLLEQDMDIFEECAQYTDVKFAIMKGNFVFFIPLSENESTEIEYKGKELIFSGSITPAQTASALASLYVMKEEPKRIQRINEIGKMMRNGFRSLGFNVGKSVTPIIPIMVGDDLLTFKFWRTLFDKGVFVNPVISPAVAPGGQLLRTSYMATHTTDQLNRVLDIFKKAGKEVGVI